MTPGKYVTYCKLLDLWMLVLVSSTLDACDTLTNTTDSRSSVSRAIDVWF